MERDESKRIDFLIDFFGQDRVIKIARMSKAVNTDSRVVPSLHISLTDHCFNKCITCGHWHREDKKELPSHELNRLIRLAAKNGLESICFTGGDPFAYGQLNEVLTCCQANGVRYGLVTGCGDPAAARYDLLANAEWIRVSFDAANEATYKRVRGGSLNLRNVHSNIRKLSDIGANVQLGITISRHNVHELPGIFDTALIMAESGRISRVDARTVYSSSKDSMASKADLSAVMPHMVYYKRELLRHGAESNIEANRVLISGKAKKCFAARYQRFIDADGTVYPCCVMAGDTLKAGISSAALGNILDRTVPIDQCWDTICGKAYAWSKQYGDCLPKACNVDCPARLDAINAVAGELCTHKDFF